MGKQNLQGRQVILNRKWSENGIPHVIMGSKGHRLGIIVTIGLWVMPYSE